MYLLGPPVSFAFSASVFQLKATDWMGKFFVTEVVTRLTSHGDMDAMPMSAMVGSWDCGLGKARARLFWGIVHWF